MNEIVLQSPYHITGNRFQLSPFVNSKLDNRPGPDGQFAFYYGTWNVISPKALDRWDEVRGNHQRII